MNLELSLVRGEIEDDIRRGLFTPFLGAGASSLRSGGIELDSYPWREVGSTLTAISAHLRSYRSLDFLRSFAEQRLRLSPEESQKIVPSLESPRPQVAPELAQSLLVKLQVEIVRVAERLTHYFGLRLSQERPSIHHLEDCSVQFDLGFEEASDSIPPLFSAADAALDLNRCYDGAESHFLYKGPEVPGSSRRLDRVSIYQRLLTLIVSLLGMNRDAYKEQLAKHAIGKNLRIPDEVNQGTVEDFGRLRFGTVQWMSELLWYTVRYWVPCYPTTRELAFELSLTVRDAPLRLPELAQAAQALENDSSGRSMLADIVGGLVNYCEAVQRRRGGSVGETAAFYYAIAAVLQHQFDIYEAKENRRRRRIFRDRFGDSDISSDVIEDIPPLPLAFTTNFDSALEQVFYENGLGYHIIFPVLRDSEYIGGERMEEPVWILRTRYSREVPIADREEVWTRLLDEKGTLQIEPVGPIIVKLHGSPGIPRPDGMTKHWLVLSEAGYLQALRDLSSPFWPLRERGVSAEMQRSLWFLGYSLSDWNVRLGLFHHRGRRRTLGLFGDVYRSAIFRQLGVMQCVGDLNHLPAMILRALTDDGIVETSPKVKRLTDRLRKHLPEKTL